MPVTIKDIAREAEVSHSTVSRALNSSPLIPEETAARIRKVAAKMGYLPSAAARTLKTNRSGALGVIIRNVDDPFFSEILQGIEEAAQAGGYSLFIAASQRDPHRERSIVQAMVERRVDGVILCSTTVSRAQSRQLARFGVPLVVVNNQAAEVYRYSIYHDDVYGSRQITRHLISLGHTRIGWLGNSHAGRSSLDRQSGFLQELEASRISLPSEYLHQEPGGGPENGLAGSNYFLALAERPTALMCYNDMMAIGVLRGMHAARVRVPGGMSVTGFDNLSLSAYTDPPLTTFDQPKRSIGAEAARLVLGLLDPGNGTQEHGPKIQMLKGELLVRGSTSAPGGKK